MHQEAYQAVARLRPTIVRDVYEIGSLNINGSVRALFMDAARYHGIDRVSGPGVDAVADGETYVPPFAPDCIVCCEVLEHATAPQAVVFQMANLLKRGGTAIITCAGPGRVPHSGVDGGRLPKGEHYRNVSVTDMERWLHYAGLAHIGVEGGPGVDGARIRGSIEPGDIYAVAVKP